VVEAGRADCSRARRARRALRSAISVAEGMALGAEEAEGPNLEAMSRERDSWGSGVVATERSLGVEGVELRSSSRALLE
jgi:hypothetical protein